MSLLDLLRRYTPLPLRGPGRAVFAVLRRLAGAARAAVRLPVRAAHASRRRVPLLVRRAAGRPARAVGRVLRPPVRTALQIARGLAALPGRLAGRCRLKAASVVARLRNSVPAPQSFWPEVKGLEASLLTGALTLLPFQQRLLHTLGRQARHVRRLRGRGAASSPLKVLHVTCSFDLGGTQRQIMNLCQQSRTDVVHDAIEVFPEHNYLYRRGVALDPARYTGTSVFGRAMGRLALNMGTRSAQTVQIYKLARDFRALSPDIVVGWGHEMCMLAFLAAALERVPHIVFCIRTFNPAFGWTTPAMGKILQASHRRMQPYLSGVITNSTLLRDDYAAWLGISAGEIQVCPNGVRSRVETRDRAGARARIRQQFDIPSDALVLCNIGRFSPEKGQLLLMRANERLLARYGELAPVWLLCGDGPLLPEVRRFAEERGMGNVRLAGRIDDVDAFLAASDVFVMPSDFEGMPNAMMEAMAHGLACVSTDRTGALDIARQGVEALYCATGASEALAAQVSTLVDSVSERERLGANARERIRQFTVERVTQTFNEYLLAIAGQSVVHPGARIETPGDCVEATAGRATGGVK